jgi:peptidoglycan/xylan/chitin deacetylase (PgdA/CDA1 family)
MDVGRTVFSALSWRVEARASRMPPRQSAQVRHRWGQVMRVAGAHRCLPDIENRAAILCFHGVTAHRPDPDVECDCLDVREFRKLLRVLRSSFHVIPLGELVAAARGEGVVPPRGVVITFDDGYANNHTVVAAELARFRMPWSAFLPAMLIEKGRRQWIDDVRLLLHRGSRDVLRFTWGGDKIDLDLHGRAGRHRAVTRVHQACRYVPEDVRTARLAELFAAYPAGELDTLRARYPSFEPMSWDQARELKAAGVDVGSHSLNHIALAPQSPALIRQEIEQASELLHARIGDHSPHFSYPYGREAAVSEDTERAVAEAGYRCGLTLEQDVVEIGRSNVLQLPRLIVSAQVGRVLFGLWQRFAR